MNFYDFISLSNRFKVIEIPRILLVDKLAEFGSIGVCDGCMRSEDTGYYVAVLNQWLCKKCYDEWISYAKWYKEDERIELKNFNFYCKLFDIDCDKKP